MSVTVPVIDAFVLDTWESVLKKMAAFDIGLKWCYRKIKGVAFKKSCTFLMELIVMSLGRNIYYHIFIWDLFIKYV